MKNALRWVWIAGLIAGCAHRLPPLVQLDQAEIQSRPVSHISQSEDQCGPAALAMVLQSLGQEASLPQLAEAVMSPELGGTLGLSLSGEARRRGNMVLPVKARGALEEALTRGSSPILLLDVGDWSTRWHFAVVVGVSPDSDLVFLRSGTEPLRVLSWKQLEDEWKASEFWGMEVLDPRATPPVHLESVYLDSAVTLERVGPVAQAAAAYRTATRVWPSNVLGWVGRGNTAFAMGNRKEAERAYRTALKLRPDDSGLAQNLSVILQGE